jgi:hypothetical protein
MNLRTEVLLGALLSLLFLNAMFLYGQSADSTLLVVNKTSNFQITGDGSAPNWQHEEWQLLPERKISGAVYQTKLKLLYSDSGIYCLYFCEDKKLTATLKEDFLDLFNEDVVEAFFWTDETIPLYFEYELSPLNFELPILVPNMKGNFLGWRPWHYEGNRRTKHETHITRNDGQVVSWTAEFFIPFTLLKPMTNVPPRKGARWRANFYRIDYDSGVSAWAWRPTRTNFHDYEKFGTLLFN